MAIRSFTFRSEALRHLFQPLLSQTHKPKLCHFRLLPSYNPPSSEDINEISRVLSDYRNPHHDLESSLNTFSGRISTNLVEQVLKRCKNLGFSAHRFFVWAKTLPGFEPSVESSRILIDILGSSKQFPLMWDFLIEMRESKCHKINSNFFWVIFWAYCRANLPEDAIRAFNRMGEFGIKPSNDDVDQLLYVLCKRKHVRHAQQVFDKVKFEFSPSVKSYSILIRGWGEIGDSSEARKLFDEMLEGGFSVDVLAYNSFLEALCKGGNGDEAYKLFREMGAKGVEPDAGTYAIFIRASCEANDIHMAFKVLDRMKRYNLIPNVYTYNCVIKKLCKNEKVEEAYELLDEMLERGVNPDSWSYNTILAFHCDHCEVTKSLRLLSRMEKDKCMPDRHTYNMVLQMLIRAGRFDSVNAVWEGMGEKGFYPSASTYAVMVHGFTKKKGKLEEACKYFEMMVDEGIPPYPSTVECLRNRLIGLGFVDQIHVLADKMKRSTSCSIQEHAKTMRGDKACGKSRNEETDLESLETD